MNVRDPIASPMHMQNVKIQTIIKYLIKISSYMNVYYNYYYSIYSKPEVNKIDYRTFKTIVPT